MPRSPSPLPPPRCTTSWAKLRAGQIGSQSFRRVVWVGHSLGAVIAYEYDGRFADIDAYALTGIIHFMEPSWIGLVMSILQPLGGPDPDI